jgi:4a-hydroxytetrahydrobiopterin dehydratase
MAEQITPRQFSESAGVEDWRVLGHGASTYFRTGTFATGVELVDAIGELADAADHHPDIDVRYAGVTVRLFSHDVMGLSQRDVELARAISAAARELDVPADPSGVQEVDLAMDALVSAEVLPFWRAVLDYKQIGEEDLVDPRARSSSISFQQMDVPRPHRNRIHVNVWVPHDEARVRIAAALDSGGALVDDSHAPAWWTLADAEGNEVNVATSGD